MDYVNKQFRKDLKTIIANHSGDILNQKDKIILALHL